MADGKLQIDKRVDHIEEAIEMIAQKLTEVLGFDEEDAEEIREILRGEKPEEQEDDAG